VFAPPQGASSFRQPAKKWATLALALLAALATLPAAGQATATRPAASAMPKQLKQPPQVVQAQRFLARRGIVPGRATARAPRWRTNTARPEVEPAGTAPWLPFGPTAVTTPGYGLVTGRVSALALDPSDSTGNRLYLGTTGGGVWMAENAGAQNPSGINFTSLSDNLAAFSGAQDASISIGALAVQPGGTGVILAGTGDPNDVLDSYYGAGILRSTDGGATWTLIQSTADQLYSFIGEGFAGFAFSTANPQLVVAAVSQAWEGVLVDADRQGSSYKGLYYSNDGGATWSLATITDGGVDVQGIGDQFAYPDGNAATSVVWNPVRQLFMAAVRYHGYYQSPDGITWTRLATQPGANLTTALCPPSQGSIGLPGCPIYRGTLAVNPMTGDTFAWTVDSSFQDQGLWQDQCAVSANACTNPIAFAQQWNTAQLETNTPLGVATIENGDYNLALAAVPSGPGAGQDTVLLAGANDLWKCSLAMGCAWRNTTNSATCMSAQVAGYQHALAWNAANPLEIFVGNDSGIWRSTDGIGETGQVCAATDAVHFQNLNGGLGSLAEVESLAQAGTTPYTMMAGLGPIGTAGVKGNSATPGDWPLILGGEGGPVAINPIVSSDWYVNNQAGVSIYACTQAGACTPAAFGASPVVTDADVGGDGVTMPAPAPFLVDALDPSQLLVGTCRVWRGPADGEGWSSTNAISPILDGGTNTYCNGDALIRSMAAMALAGGKEVVYVGMYGSGMYGTAMGSSILPGHILSATLKPGGGLPVWNDLTLNPVVNDSNQMNAYSLDISSIVLDAHDTTGNTVYVTVAGFASPTQEVEVVYRSTDGGAHWAYLTSNLPPAPANALVVDPQDACTVYLATDAGVYSTRQVTSCADAGSTCWSAFGSGLPMAPVVALGASPATASAQLLTAATYGRGIWQIPEWTADTHLAAAAASPDSWTFPSQLGGGSSAPEPVTVTNTGAIPLTITGIAVTGDSEDFSASGCASQTLQPGGTCTIQVTFTPTAAGVRNGTLTIDANVSCGQVTVALSGTGIAPPVELSPASIAFGGVPVGITIAGTPVTVTNTTAATVTFTAPFTVGKPFALAGNTCTAGSLAAGAACVLTVEFSPTVSGAASGILSFGYQAGTQAGTANLALSGAGQAAATDTLSATTLAFPATVEGQLSAAQTLTLTNGGDLPLTFISMWTSAGYQTSNNCGGTLAGQASCTVSVVFVPSQTGSQPGTLSVADVNRTQTVSLSGSGLQPPVLTVTPASLSFATQLVGQPSPASALTVSNTGGAPMANVGFQFMGQSASSFSSGVTTCGAVLNNGGSCTVQVLFTPAVTGGSAATLVVSSSTNGVAPVSVPLSGTGTAPGALSVSPAQMTFPVVSPGQTSTVKGVFITNTGSGSLSSVNLGINSPFSLATNTCIGSLGPGSSCSAGVTFSPAVNGSFSGVLSVSSPSLGIAANVTLSGIGGVPGSLQAQPGIVNFPVTGLGSASSPITVSLTNPSGVGSLTNLHLGATGTFKVTSTCPTTLAALATCQATVVFSPTSAGPQSGNMTVSSDAFTSGSFLPLHGVGFDFTVSASGSTSQTVISGQTANFPLSFTLVDQTKEAVLAVSCNTAPPFPPYATCAFNPSANPKVPAGSDGNATVMIATGQAQTAARAGGWTRFHALPLACGLLLLPFALGKRRRALLLAVLLVILAGGVSSCTSSSVFSGGGTPRTGPGITPSATYKIPVDVVSNNVTHTIVLTLIVD
jgi:hypothetical protein